ncbi:MAG TPA: FimV/HubP family polar landmark protein [Gammaproteobacteria bacterium]|nr:FimV/HubP family polar landmark protein [Gammaproteobacteria bacterium]
MSKKLVCVLTFATALAMPLAASALGLGEIKLNSALNQDLNADIQIVGAASDELDSLQVKLASQAQFQQAGIDYPAVLSNLRFQVVRKADGTAYLHVTSPGPIREPFLDFLIDANWDNGELLREYTVLLNPPNFETPTKAAASKPAVAAPAPSPTATLIAPETPKAAPAAPPTAAPTPAPAPAETTPMPAQPAPSPAPTAIVSAPAASKLGTDYGPIHRGETLSEIAGKLRPDSVTLNQMMVAIYRANPEVFMHNINRMKAGYVMRIPSLGDIQAITVSEANSEVRTQIQDWRASRGLATSKPEKAESAAPALQLVAPSSAAETAENQVPGAGESATGTAAAGKPATETAAPEPSVAPPPLPEPATPAPAGASPSPSQAPVTVKSSGMSAVESQAGKLNQKPESKGLPLPAEKPPVAKPLAPGKRVTKPVIKPVQPAPAASTGIVDTLMGALSNLYVLIAIAVVVILVLVGVVIKKRRSGAPSKSKSLKPGRISGADWLEQEQAGTDDLTVAVTTRTRTKKAKGKVEPTPEPVMDRTPEPEPEVSDKTVMVPPPTAEMAGAAPVKLDDSDPVAEADFHMAYGLYDQAADVLKKALSQNPGRRDVKMKLLEVYFTAGDATNFVDVARGLREDMGGASDKDWENVAIMGRQVAPNEPMFAATGTASGAGTSSSVDIALDGGGTDTMVSDLDPLAGAFGDAAPGAEPHAGTAILTGADFAAEPAAEAAPAAADDALEFSLPDLEPASSPEPEPASTASPAAADQGGGLEFDLGDINIEPTPSEKKAEPRIEEPAVSTDFGTDSQVEFDKALKELSDFVNTNVPPQEEEASADGGLGAGLSLDGEMPSMAASAAPTEDAGANSLSEVGTKLDLARAYIDMGDPDGAKSILDEVMEEGTAQQKQEAQELMKHLG